MKVGDLVRCPSAYGAKGIIVEMRKQMYYTKLVCDVWLFDIEPEDGKKVYTFMQSQLEVINKGA
tara:strand:+ start:415 stop:606 length:192 start_codon:yes stop_codon:yes gene_type:complete